MYKIVSYDFYNQQKNNFNNYYSKTKLFFYNYYLILSSKLNFFINRLSWYKDHILEDLNLKKTKIINN